jgi:RHS repeat-associated protein
MGFFLKNDFAGRESSSAFFRVAPKQLTPGLRMQERGARFYSPELGRWLSRDPIEENGGINLFVFVENNTISGVDAIGLWATSEHSPLTRSSCRATRLNIPFPCVFNIMRWLEVWDEKVDDSTSPLSNTGNGRHYDREDAQSQGAAIVAFNNIISSEISTFKNYVGGTTTPTESDCKEALKALGRVTHSWQDYYAHALLEGDYNDPQLSEPSTATVVGHTHKLWTATPSITGDPDNPRGGNGKIAPTTGGEHGAHWTTGPNAGVRAFEKGHESETDARRAAAIDYVKQQYRHWIPIWYVKCKCYCDTLRNP